MISQTPYGGVRVPAVRSVPLSNSLEVRQRARGDERGKDEPAWCLREEAHRQVRGVRPKARPSLGPGDGVLSSPVAKAQVTTLILFAYFSLDFAPALTLESGSLVGASSGTVRRKTRCRYSEAICASGRPFVVSAAVGGEEEQGESYAV